MISIIHYNYILYAIFRNEENEGTHFVASRLELLKNSLAILIP